MQTAVKAATELNASTIYRHKREQMALTSMLQACGLAYIHRAVQFGTRSQHGQITRDNAANISALHLYGLATERKTDSNWQWPNRLFIPHASGRLMR